MAFQHIFLSQNLPKYLRILFDNIGIWNDINNPLHLMRCRMPKCKRQRGNCFSSTGRNSQTKHSLFLSSHMYTMSQNLTASAVDRIVFFIFQPSFILKIFI